MIVWFTGQPGSGKTTLANAFIKFLKNENSQIKIINLDGDDLRNILNLKKFSKIERIDNGIKFSKLCEYITNQNINIVFAVVGLFKKIRRRNRLKIKNYVEIFIKSEIEDIIKKGKKNTYKKNKRNIMGKDIKAELPKNPDIIINNDLNRKTSIEKLSKELIIKIKRHLHEKK